MTKMSIHQGLAELTLLEKRINQSLADINFISQHVPGKAVKGFSRTEEYKEEAKAKYQSVQSLIKRRGLIKSAIVMSNATTTIDVGGTKMTVAEAIAYKNDIKHEQALLDKLRRDYDVANREIDRTNLSVKSQLAELLKAMFGSDTKNKQEDVKTTTDSYLKDNEAVLVDPIGARKEIDKLQKKVDDFLSQVDYRLSESNTLTSIDIED